MNIVNHRHRSGTATKPNDSSLKGALIDQLADNSLYLPVPARIIDCKPLTECEKLFKIELPEGISLNHRPGQFVQVSVFGVGEAPISISSSPSRSNHSFEICVRNAGTVTGALHRLVPEAMIGIRGPFGNGFQVERLQGKDLLFIPGGLGLASLRSLINQVLDQRSRFGRVWILYGARTPGELLFTDELRDWAGYDDVDVHITVDRSDEDWKGNVGVVTKLIPKVKVYPPNTVAFTCGPPIMYRFVLIELLGLGIREGNIWLSLERRMKCGVGKCGHCQVNHVYTCQKGPCFSYAQIKHLEEAL